MREVRFCPIRRLGRKLGQGEEIFAATASYTADGAPHFRRLWLRRFNTPHDLQQSVEQARFPGSNRRLCLVRAEQRLLIEEDRGEALLPTLESTAGGSG